MNMVLSKPFHIFSQRWKSRSVADTLWLLLIFIGSEIIVHPSGNFPLNDDWSYAKSVVTLLNEHKIDIGAWPSMTLATHLVWGFVFTWCFGFSFTTLRFSTLVSSFVGILILFRLIHRISGSRQIAYIASLTLLFNPLYFNLSNTYMTDVNFNTLFLLGIYFAYDFFSSKNVFSFLMVFMVSTCLILLRQYGLVLPFCFLLLCFSLKEKKWLYAGTSVLLFLLVIVVFKYYEAYLKSVLPPSSTYKFSGNLNPSQRVFWDILIENLQLRYGMVLFHVLFYVFPLSLVFLCYRLQNFNKLKAFFLFAVLFSGFYFLFLDKGYQMPNVFTGMSVGTETFFQTLKGTDDGNGHNNPKVFELIMPYLSALFMSGTLMAILLSVFNRSGQKEDQPRRTELLFLSALFLSYTVMILVTDSYFDRYHIPLITLSLIFLSHIRITGSRKFVIPIMILVLFFYTSVFGTKDYFTLHRTTWGAYGELRKERSLKPEQINAGFEIYNWNDGNYSWWWEFMYPENFKYIIQYDKEPGFKRYKSYEFQRYFPYKKDTISIFVREDGKK
jgi:hypothetical protein